MYDILIFYEQEVKWKKVSDIEFRHSKFKQKEWKKALSNVAFIKAKGTQAISIAVQATVDEEFICYGYDHLQRKEILKHLRNSFAHVNITEQGNYIIAEDFKVNTAISSQTSYMKLKTTTLKQIVKLLNNRAR